MHPLLRLGWVALALAPVGAWSVRFVARDTLLLFALAVIVAGVRTLMTSGRAEPKDKMSSGKRMAIGGVIGGFAGYIWVACWVWAADSLSGPC